MKEFWNTRYAAPEFAYGVEPNLFFKTQIDALPVGKILLPSEGEGRNAVYAASLGWNVTAFDYSEEGQQKALELAEKHGVTIYYTIADASEFQTDEKFDVVALIFSHFPPQYERHFTTEFHLF